MEYKNRYSKYKSIPQALTEKQTHESIDKLADKLRKTEIIKLVQFLKGGQLERTGSLALLFISFFTDLQIEINDISEYSSSQLKKNKKLTIYQKNTFSYVGTRH